MFANNKLFALLILLTLFKQSNGIDNVQVLSWYSQQNDLIALIKKYLPENPIIIDAGAFDGTDSIVMSTLIPGSTIHAFEPDPENYLKLQKKIKTHPNIFCYSAALGDKNGITHFHRSQDDKRHDRQSGSLLAPKDHLEQFPHITFNQVIDVFTTTLDSWAQNHDIDHVDFLWLDLQGVELNVLMASPHILKNVKVIYTEVEFIEQYTGQFLYEDVKQWLENEGFTMIAKDFISPGYSGYKSMGNILIVREHK